MTPKYEHRVFASDTEGGSFRRLEELLNAGWQLLSMNALPGNGVTHGEGYLVVLRREVLA